MPPKKKKTITKAAARARAARDKIKRRDEKQELMKYSIRVIPDAILAIICNYLYYSNAQRFITYLSSAPIYAFKYGASEAVLNACFSIFHGKVTIFNPASLAIEYVALYTHEKLIRICGYIGTTLHYVATYENGLLYCTEYRSIVGPIRVCNTREKCSYCDYGCEKCEKCLKKCEFHTVPWVNVSKLLDTHYWNVSNDDGTLKYCKDCHLNLNCINCHHLRSRPSYPANAIFSSYPMRCKKKLK